jgi:hypothetical protein
VEGSGHRRDVEVLQRWPVSKRVNSSKAPADDPTLIERVAIGPELIANG